MPPLLDRLIQARQSGDLIMDVPAEHKPSTLDEAYRLADALALHIGGEIAGWKIGANIPRAWERLGLSEPFGGRIFAGTVYTSPAVLSGVRGTLTIGAEFAPRLARDLGVDERFTAETVREVVDEVFTVLELNRPHYVAPLEIGGLSLIADNGVNVGLVLGQPIPGWIQVELAEVPVVFRVNGVEKSSGRAKDIGFDDPFAALAWLANDRARRGDPLKAGQYVSTGDLVFNVEANTGDSVQADFGAFGIVELKLNASE
jgi:2-keto-4-pentenoate hydratase